MKGKNGKSLEKSIFRRFEKLKKIEKIAEENREEIDKIYKKMEGHFSQQCQLFFTALQLPD